MLTRRAAVVFGVADLLTAVLVVFGVFVALPARFWPVDVAAGTLASLDVASAAGLLAGTAWGPRVAAASAVAFLAVGLALVSALALTASWLSGVYGPVGRGGAVILVLVAALAVPYLVVMPAVKLMWTWPPRKAS
ncbi:MAG: hypothetical protein FWD17_02840 [Polyangiaceae bacterium]|nr:hypothetical protein [Polyangiaceae bacterium]